jgi:phosphoribosylglycinamide formyltransferase 2
MVTMATQSLSEFALHVRAILGLPVPTPDIPIETPGASAVLLAKAEDTKPVVEGLAEALAVHPSVDVRIFGKPDARPNRRMGVALATGRDVETARERAQSAAAALRVI